MSKIRTCAGEPSSEKGIRRLRHESLGVSLWKSKIRPALAMLVRLFPIKLTGIFLLAGAALLLVYFGFLQQDLILLMASLVLTLVALLDILLVCLGAFLTHRWWRFTQSQLPQEISPLLTGVPGQLPLARRPPWLPLVEVKWRWLQPSQVEVSWGKDYEGCYEQFTFPHRGLISKVEREFEVCDILGFASVKLRYTQPLHLQILPQSQPLDRRTFVSSLHGGDDMSDPRGEPVGDRVDMRQYAAGDPPKLLLWKLYARTGKLMVRQSERAVSPTPRTCAYLVAGPQDEAAAGLARNILESGLLGAGWRFGADGNQGHCQNIEEALLFLARSGNQPTEVGLRGYLEQAAKDGFNGCLVILPSQPGPWLDEVARSARVRNVDVSFAAAPGYIDATARPGPAWWQKLRPYVFSTPQNQLPGEPEAVLRRLSGVGKERWLYVPAQRGFVRYGGKGG